MPEQEEQIRWTVLFSGTVQGVGFRYTTRRLAGGFAITGQVRNLPDGRVELVAEGTPTELQALLDAVERALGRYIRDRRVTEAPASGHMQGFSIAF